MRTSMKLNDSSLERYVIESTNEHEHFLAKFIAAVASGGITLQKIAIKFPEQSIVEGTGEYAHDHYWEELDAVDVSFQSEKPLKTKTAWLKKAEKESVKKLAA
jgi:hypothetical protein